MLIHLILINIKSILLVVMVTELYAMMIDVVNQCKHKIQFTVQLKICSKKMSIVKKL